MMSKNAISRCIIILFLVQSSILDVYSNDTTRVLFVGNSFTYYNDMHLVFKDLAQGAGKIVEVGLHAPGGVSVGDISQGTMAHMNNPDLYQMMKLGKWDYMVVQDNQGRFVYDYGVFPSSSLVIEGHIMLRDSFQYYNHCGKVIWFAGWGPKDGYPPFASTGSGLIDKIYNNYIFLQDTASQIIAPIGPAWKRIIANHPSINLWGSDLVHPGIEGTFLSAAVIYSSIFKINPLNSSYLHVSISQTTDSILKSTGYQTVIDSINHTGLQVFTQNIQANNGQLVIPGSTDVEWYLNDSLVQNGNTCTPLTSGYYSAFTYDSLGCGSWTLPFYYQHGMSIFDLNPKNEIQFWPNPASNNLQINSKEKGVLTISSIGGQILMEQELEIGITTLNISNLNQGIYTLMVVYGQKTMSQILIKTNQ